MTFLILPELYYLHNQKNGVILRVVMNADYSLEPGSRTFTQSHGVASLIPFYLLLS